MINRDKQVSSDVRHVATGLDVDHRRLVCQPSPLLLILQSVSTDRRTQCSSNREFDRRRITFTVGAAVPLLSFIPPHAQSNNRDFGFGCVENRLGSRFLMYFPAYM